MYQLVVGRKKYADKRERERERGRNKEKRRPGWNIFLDT